jgi:hypothetical protein
MDDYILINMKEKYEIWEPFEDICKNTEKIEKHEMSNNFINAILYYAMIRKKKQKGQ